MAKLLKLLHGTTWHRAGRILVVGPDPDFREGSGEDRAESFSAFLESGPFGMFGTPEDYARGKAVGFPTEGGPAIIEFEVPDYLIALAVSAFLPLSQGLVQFDQGAGLEELRAAWSSLPKKIVVVE